MRSTFGYTAKVLLRDRGVLLWALAFPLILMTLFYSVFSRLDATYQLPPLPLAVVAVANYRSAAAFADVIDELDRSGGPDGRPLFTITEADSESEARELIVERNLLGYVVVDSQAAVRYSMNAARAKGSSTSFDDVYQGVVLHVLDQYTQNSAMVAAALSEDPRSLTDPAVMAALNQSQQFTQRGSLTANPPSSSLPYFYAALAFAVVMVMSFATRAVELWRANASALGARRCVGGQSWVRSLTPTLAVAWLLSFGSAGLGFAYLRFVFHVDFGGKEPACVLLLAVATAATTLLGALVAAVPVAGLRGALGTVIPVVCSMFAGLYGPPSQQLGNWAAGQAPLLAALNPVRAVYEGFTCLYLYDGYERYFHLLAILAALSVVFFFACVLVMRRTTYRSL